jgi:hypothetical protein
VAAILPPTLVDAQQLPNLDARYIARLRKAIADVNTQFTTIAAGDSAKANVNAPAFTGLQNAASDAAAAALSVPVGGVYRNGSVLMIRVT